MSKPPRSLAPQLSLLREQRYRRHVLREDSRQTVRLGGVVGAAFVVLAGNDLLLLRGSWLLWVALASRLQLLVATAIAIVLLRRARWPREQSRAVNLWLIALAIGVVVANLTRIPLRQTPAPFVVAGGAVLWILYVAQRGPLGPRAVVGSIITASTVVALCNPLMDAKLAVRVTGFVAIVAVNAAGIFSARAFEEQRRKRFEAERRERHLRQDLAAKLSELAIAKERAESMSRARAAFLAAMSHEFRTPMNAVIGLSDVLLDDPLAPGRTAHIRTINESARALLSLLNDILDFAKIDAQELSLSPAPFDLRKVAASVVDMLRPQAKARSVDLELVISPEVPACLFGDDARLRQVLVNLASNAIKFTEQGAVTLRIAARALPASMGDHEIDIRVEDTGIGMKPDVISRLFRPFGQADGGIARRYGGTGLGLAISRQIVRAMGGDIHVESEPGRGSVFSFALRLPETGVPLEAAPLAPRENRLPLAILVVDDNAINREVARARLGSLGYAADLASDGPGAVEAASKKNYDAILMDLHMPGMSGIDVTTRIREQLAGKRAPHVIAMTASVFDEDRRACAAAGMRDFVDKPIDLAQLDAVLRRVAEERGASISSEGIAATLAREPLEKLRRTNVPGDPDFFARLCQLFLIEAERRLPRISEALERSDARAIEDEAHILKSSSAALGATAMSDLCARIERAAREGRIEEIQSVMEAFQAEYHAVERALRQGIQSHRRAEAF